MPLNNLNGLKIYLKFYFRVFLFFYNVSCRKISTNNIFKAANIQDCINVRNTKVKMIEILNYNISDLCTKTFQSSKITNKTSQ
ncbi:hypothetical protein CWI39_2800p0010 [Hamiltosporidium magnivora]|uniref:Uncharacterized protein n=1 Tax=Hamiltosporidium magnivora TaxID=148818 RepID=A0A4Q9KT34_9MICR|nr:hypothetical protein CWI39_2800p0010 [Hamiltosporidium magnivora]